MNDNYSQKGLTQIAEFAIRLCVEIFARWIIWIGNLFQRTEKLFQRDGKRFQRTGKRFGRTWKGSNALETVANARKSVPNGDHRRMKLTFVASRPVQTAWETSDSTDATPRLVPSRA